MLPHGQDAALHQPRGEGQPQARGGLRVAGEGAVPDHGVVRVAVDVQHGGEVDVDADGAQFGADGLTEGPGAFRLPAFQERACARGGKARKVGLPEARDPAPFLVHRDERARGLPARRGADLAAQCADLGGRLDVSGEEHDAADLAAGEPPRKRRGERRPLEPHPQRRGDRILADDHAVSNLPRRLRNGHGFRRKGRSRGIGRTTGREGAEAEEGAP